VTPESQLEMAARGQKWWRPYPNVVVEMELPKESDPRVQVDLEPGLYVLELFANWEGTNNVFYGFLIEVRQSRPTATEPGPAPTVDLIPTPTPTKKLPDNVNLDETPADLEIGKAYTTSSSGGLYTVVSIR